MIMRLCVRVRVTGIAQCIDNLFLHINYVTDLVHEDAW